MSIKRPTAGKVSLVYVCFMDFVINGVKLGVANRIENRAYHLSLDWGNIDTKRTFYFLSNSHGDPTLEIRNFEKAILDKLYRLNLTVKPCYPNGDRAHGTGESEFFSHRGISIVRKEFMKWEKEGKGQIITGFEPSKNRPPLRNRPPYYHH